MSWLQNNFIMLWDIFSNWFFVAMFFLMQTPYAENPLWTMVLLWPLYFFGIN